MKNFVAWFGGIVLCLGLCLGLLAGVTFGVPAIRLQVYKMFGKEFESTRTDIYRENKSHVEGTIRDLREMQREYLTAESEHQSALRSLILHRAGELDWDRLPADLRGFLKDLEEN